YTIRPFNDHDLTSDPTEARRRKKFNKRLSQLRIAVEHAFGRLKGRFPALRAMHGRKLGDIYRAVEALMIIHNILERRSDDPRRIPRFNGREDRDRDGVRGRAAEEMELWESDDAMYRAGLYRRKQLLDKIIPRV
ncbi:hypothetical protein FOMPIDRAFT_1129721, partial [Fomitopsis schrenkii]